ncbi:hypothetical protein LU11_gp041 [Pseudomonas phage Lu11]|uniref:hypothetical protein n=1 Tax=Pseudomonas phage Lu11 TaxID=1161927 RepID=UPI00025F1503|nr:hypothetical protein LU11_gp041 [Pseudomonas phage Lu11]AFH14572.1 hypothetical protein Lu11_0041 [Pseudomonas phage Lu11]
MAFGSNIYVAIGATGVYESSDKFDWKRTSDLQFSHVVYANGFYAVAADGIYVKGADGWALAHAFVIPVVCARNVNGEALFGTTQGTILRSSDWSEVSVGLGAIWLSDSSDDILDVLLVRSDYVESLQGTLNNLVSTGTTEIDGLTVHACAYDDVNKCVVASLAFDGQPMFAVLKNNQWLFSIVALDEPAISLARGAVLTSNAVYTTTDYVSFTLLHSFADFEAQTLAYL